MENKNIEDELVSIRSMMERSSKFISLSGLSGIMAGVYALLGAVIAYYQIYSVSGFLEAKNFSITKPADFFEGIDIFVHALIHLIVVAVIVLIAAIGTGIYLSFRKAKRNNQSIWNNTTRSLLFYAAIPLLTGGLFILIMISRGYYGVIAPASLIFYGLSVISGSHYTFTDVKYLGILQIILGLIAALYPGYGLIFWALGFGVLHIVYGSIMYFKYDR